MSTNETRKNGTLTPDENPSGTLSRTPDRLPRSVPGSVPGSVFPSPRGLRGLVPPPTRADLFSLPRVVILPQTAEEADISAAENEIDKIAQDYEDDKKIIITEDILEYIAILEMYVLKPLEISEEKYKEAINYFKDEEFNKFCRFVGFLTGPSGNFNTLWNGFYDYDENGFTNFLENIDKRIIVNSFKQLIDEVPSVLFDSKILHNLNIFLKSKCVKLFPKYSKCSSVEIFDADLDYYHMFKLMEIIGSNIRV